MIMLLAQINQIFKFNYHKLIRLKSIYSQLFPYFELKIRERKK